MKTVGIIGAGAAGLCSARHFKNFADFTPVVWEQSRVIGGTWVYTDAVDKDENGLPIHSSMYKNLKTNIPKEIMNFPDFAFKKGGSSFCPHTEVLEYLQNYARHYDLLPHIKFSHEVKEVRPTGDGDWLITTQDLTNGEASTTKCDAVLVCNGHFSVPLIPELEGMEKFEGFTQHSHCYRSPEAFAGKTVVVLGASASGLDISLEVAAVAKKVYLSHNRPTSLPSALPPNVSQISGLKGVEGKGTFSLRDGGSVDADAVLFCTGYRYVFPFLHEECGISVHDSVVSPLYKHVINTKHPTMAFIGIPVQVCPFPFMDVQVRYFRAALAGAVAVPHDATPDNARHTATQRHIGVTAGRHFHKFGELQWPFLREISDQGGVENLAKVYEKLYEHVAHKRAHELMFYKGDSYRIVDKQSFATREL